jgi:hypothetical protein
MEKFNMVFDFSRQASARNEFCNNLMMETTDNCEALETTEQLSAGFNFIAK